MMTSSGPQLWDVWRLAFEYEDMPGKKKERPVIIGAIDGGNALALVVKVTSHAPRNDFPGEVALKDWREAGLSKPYTARCSKTLLIPLEAFEHLQRYGHLSKEDSTSVLEALRSLNKIL